MDINDLLQKKNQLIYDMQAIDTAAGDELLSGENLDKFNAMKADVEVFDQEISRKRDLEKLNLESIKPLANNTPNEPDAKQDYKNAFWDNVRKGPSNLSPQIINTLKTGDDANGGYIVPEEYDKELTKKLLDNNDFRKYVSVTQTSSNLHIPVEVTHGAATWLAEEAAYGGTEATFGRISLEAHKLGRIIKVSDELLRDAFFNVDAYIADAFGRSFGQSEEAAIVAGDGTGKPTGFSGAGVAVNAADNETISLDDIIKLIYGLARPYRRNAMFVLNDSTVSKLRLLKDTQGRYLWEESNKVGEPSSLMGYKVMTSVDMPAVGNSAKSVVFGDLSYYSLVDRIGTSMTRLGELYAATGQVGFRIDKRLDGKLTLSEAIVELTHPDS